MFIDHFGYNDINELNDMVINLNDIYKVDQCINVDNSIKNWNKQKIIDTFKGSLTGTLHVINRFLNKDDIIINYHKHPFYLRDDFRKEFYLAVYKADLLIKDSEKEIVWNVFNKKLNLFTNKNEVSDININLNDSSDNEKLNVTTTNNNNDTINDNNNKDNNDNGDDDTKTYKLMYIAFTNPFISIVDIISKLFASTPPYNISLPLSYTPFFISLQSIITFIDNQSMINIHKIPISKILSLLISLTSKFRGISLFQNELVAIFTILDRIATLSNKIFSNITNSCAERYYKNIMFDTNTLIFKLKENIPNMYYHNKTIITLLLKCLLFYMENTMESTVDLSKQIIQGRKPTDIDKVMLSKYYYKLYCNHISETEEKGKFKRFLVNIKDMLIEGNKVEQEIIEILFRNHVKEMFDLLFSKYTYDYIKDSLFLEQMFMLIIIILSFPIDIESYDIILHKVLCYPNNVECEWEEEKECNMNKRNSVNKKSMQKGTIKSREMLINESITKGQNSLVLNMLEHTNFNTEHKKVYSLIKTLFPNVNDDDISPYKFNRFTANILAYSYVNKERLFIVKDKSFTNINNVKENGIHTVLALDDNVSQYKDVPYINLERLINGILSRINSKEKIRLYSKFLWYNTLHLSIFNNKTFNTFISCIVNPSKPMLLRAMNHLSSQLRLFDICTACAYVMPSSLFGFKYINSNACGYYTPVGDTQYAIMSNIIQPFLQLLKNYLERYLVEYNDDLHVINDILIQVKKITTCFCFMLNSLYDENILLCKDNDKLKEDVEALNKIIDEFLSYVYTFLYMEPNNIEHSMIVLNSFYTCKETIGLLNNDIILKCITITLISAFPKLFQQYRNTKIIANQLQKFMLQMKELFRLAGKTEHAVEYKFHLVKEESVHCSNIGQFLLLYFLNSIKNNDNSTSSELPNSNELSVVINKESIFSMYNEIFTSYPDYKKDEQKMQSIELFLKQAKLIIHSHTDTEEQENKIRKQLYKTLKHNFNNTSIYIKQDMLIVLNQQISLNAYDIYLVTEMNYNRFTLSTRELNTNCGSRTQHNELLNAFGKTSSTSNDKDNTNNNTNESKQTAQGFDIALYYLTSFGLDKLERIKNLLDKKKLQLLLQLNERSLKQSFNVGVFYVNFTYEVLQTKHLLTETYNVDNNYKLFLKALNKGNENDDNVDDDESHVYISEDKFNEIAFMEYNKPGNEHVKNYFVCLIYLENGHQNIKEIHTLFHSLNDRVFFFISHIDKSFYLVRRRINKENVSKTNKGKCMLNNYIIDINNNKSIQFMIKQIICTYDYLMSECNDKLKKSNYECIEQRKGLFSQLLEDNENENEK